MASFPNPILQCPICGLISEEDYLECSLCKTITHLSCLSLPLIAAKELMKSNEGWLCGSCKNDMKNGKDSKFEEGFIRRMKSYETQVFEQNVRVRNVEEKTEELSNNFGDMKKRMEGFDRRQKESEAKIIELRKEVGASSIEMQRRVTRRNNLIVHSLPEVTDVDPVDSFIELVKAIGISLLKSDIICCSRIGEKKNDKPRTLIVELFGFKRKREIYDAKKKLREVESYKKVKITHDYTRQQREFFNASKNVQGPPPGGASTIDLTEELMEQDQETSNSQGTKNMKRKFVPGTAEGDYLIKKSK